jgi:hypothetical protein
MSKETTGQFDKFVEDIVRREQETKDKQKAYAESHEENPYLEYNKLYRERWQNRVYSTPPIKDGGKNDG